LAETGNIRNVACYDSYVVTVNSERILCFVKAGLC